MAYVSIVKKASALAVVAAVVSAGAVAAQELAPAPSPDAGAALALPASGFMIGTSLVISFVALFRN